MSSRCFCVDPMEPTIKRLHSINGLKYQITSPPPPLYANARIYALGSGQRNSYNFRDIFCCRVEKRQRKENDSFRQEKWFTVCLVRVNCQWRFTRLHKVNLFATWKKGDWNLQTEIGHVTNKPGSWYHYPLEKTSIHYNFLLSLCMKEIILFLYLL